MGGQVSSKLSRWVRSGLLGVACALPLQGVVAQPRSAVSPLVTSQNRPTPSDDIRELMREAKRLIVDAFPEDRARAEEILIDATRFAPSDPEPYAQLARYVVWQVANGLKDPIEVHRASELAGQVRELAPDRPLGDFLASEIMMTLGQIQQAVALFKHALNKYPDHPDTFAFEARYWSESDPARALLSAQRALALGESMDDLSPAIALALKTSAKHSSAGDALARFAEVYPDRWLWHRAGVAYAEEKNYSRAKVAFKRAIELGNELESRLQLGILEYTQVLDPKDAIVQLSTLRRALDARLEARDDARALVSGHLALAYLADGRQVKPAVEAGSRALRLGVRNVTLVAGFFEEFRKQHLGEAFRRPLEEVAQENPVVEYPHVTLGLLAIERKDFQEAQKRYSDALALSPDRDDLYAARAHAAYGSARFEAALHDFDAAVRLRPDFATHHYNRACMLALLGRKNEAVAALREALLINRELGVLAQSDNDLASLRADVEYSAQLSRLGVTTATVGTQAANETDSDDESEATE